MAGTFSVIISPKLKKGKNEKEVSKNLSQLLKVDQKKALGWLKAKQPTVIVRGVSELAAKKYSQAILNAGASCDIQPTANAGQSGGKSSAKSKGSDSGSSRKSSFLTSLLMVILTAGSMYGANYWLQMRERQRLMATSPSQQVLDTAQATAAAVNLYQSGNRKLLAEMAEVASVMRGMDMESIDQTSSAALDMIKGLGSKPFLKLANEGAVLGATDGTGKILGVKKFTFEEINKISPALFLYGHENLLSRTAERDEKPVAENADAKVVLVDRLDRLEDAEVSELMKGLLIDQEWDQYLEGTISSYLETEVVNEAVQLIDQIKNPALQVQAYGKVMLYLEERNQLRNIDVYKSGALTTVDRLANPDFRGRVLMDLGRDMTPKEMIPKDTSKATSKASNGVLGTTIELFKDKLAKSKNTYEKPFLAAHLAVAQFQLGDMTGAGVSIKRALYSVNAIAEKVERLSAFCKLSKRYYDLRRLILAEEILSQAAVIAAKELDGSERARIFGEIAIARGYMGDTVGAMMAIGNASTGRGKQQMLFALGRSFVELDRPHQAWIILNEITDEVEYSKLLVRLVGRLIHTGDQRQAAYYFSGAGLKARQIATAEIKMMVVGQFARLYKRLGEDRESNSLFAHALTSIRSMSGRKADFSLASIALDQARAQNLEGARISVGKIKESIVKDIVAAEIDRTEMILKNLLPAGI